MTTPDAAAALPALDKAVEALIAPPLQAIAAIDQAYAISAPVVAAELRRLAYLYETLADGYAPSETEVARRVTYSAVAMKLRARADELDPPQ